MRPGVARVTKRDWYAMGGFRNSALFRRMYRGSWQYFADYWRT
jgi:hypothetical protein